MAEPASGPKGRGRITRTLLALGASALAAFFVAGVSTDAALAQDPFHLEFSHGKLQLGSADLAVGPADPATLDGEIDPATGELTVPTEGVHMPAFYFFSGPLTGALVQIDPQEPVTGSFDESTGELDMAMLVDLHAYAVGLGAKVKSSPSPTMARGALPYPDCAFEDVEWNLSTSNSFGSLQGARFVDGLGGAGAIVTSWEDLPATPDTAWCNQVRPLLDGPGGLLLGPPLCDGQPATIVGTPGKDELSGTGGDDVMAAGFGNDRLRGLEGDDRLCGGNGKDSIQAGEGDDRSLGGRGWDEMTGDAGNDHLHGGAGSDEVRYFYAPQPINANLAAGAATGEGTDALLGIERLVGGAFGDTLRGDRGRNDLNGLDGDDRILGGDGLDRIYGGGLGDDRILGGGGPDRIYGDLGDDKLFGMGGVDKLVGHEGSDLCDGGPNSRGHPDVVGVGCEVTRGIP